MILAPGARVGPYQIVSLIGHGGVGEVYLADDPRLRRQVALKILNAKFAGDENARARFLREAQMAAGLDHPNICALHEIGTDGDFDYLVMPFLRGETLAERLERGPLPVSEGLDIAVQLADALAYAHGTGVIHRDIKPQNVMLTPEGRVKLMDFGLAKAPGRIDDRDETRAALTATGAFFGTIAYMSPEQLAGHAADARSDIFSLGMTLYQIFAGRHPYAGSTAAAMITAIASKPPAVLSKAAPDAPYALTPIVAHALALDPRQRYQSAGELHADLESVRRGTPVGAAPAAPRSRNARIRLAILLAILVGLIALAPSCWVTYFSSPTTAPQPASTAAPPAAPAKVVSRLEIQPVGAGVAQDPYEPPGVAVLKNGWKFRVHVVPNAAGSLYIVTDERGVSSDSRELALQYPPAGAAGTISGETASEWYVVGGPPADTSLWVVWSRASIAELDALRPLVNAKERGIVRDPAKADGVRRLLAAAENGAGTDLVARRFELQQR